MRTKCDQRATHMRKTIIVASTIFLGAGAAWAGEMSVGKMDMEGNPAMRWAGSYTGAAAGFSWGKVKDRDLEIPQRDFQRDTITQSKTINGASYGGYVGHNWVAGQIVYGVEANFSGSTMNKDLIHEPVYSRSDYTYQTTHEVTWYGTAVGRLGVAQGPLLLYVNGGVVLGNDKTAFSVSINDTVYSDPSTTTTHWGWTAGAGVEYAINDVLSTRVEFDHVDYAEKSVMHGTDNVDVRFETVKFGITVKMQ
jgi:outer membrane immunogenic protein